MENLRKIYQEIQDQEKFRAVVSDAKARFEVKPFVQENYNLKKIVSLLRPVLSVFSIITGFGFLAYQFANALNFFVSAVFAVVLLVFLELLKGEFSQLAFKRFFVKSNNSGLNYSLLFFALVFFALSVFLSVNGVKELYKQLDKSEIDFKANHQVQKDSLIKSFDSRIEAEKTALLVFKNSVSWQGKINITDKTVANSIASYTAKIDSLEADKRQAITGFTNLSDKELNNLEAKNGFNLSFWFWLSLGIELLIILCLWFDVWFAYRTAKEAELFGGHYFDNYKFDVSAALQSFVRFTNTYQAPTLLESSENSNKNLVTAKTETPSDAPASGVTFSQDKKQIFIEHPYLKKYSEVAKGIINGMTFEQIEATYKVSAPTISNVSNLLQDLNIIEKRGKKK
jgi:hypothetical protein